MTTRSPERPAAGFTLIEIMVVVAILAIVAQLVISNIGAIVPATVLDSESQKLMSEVEYLRSEAQLQGKTFKLQLDLDKHRYRRILPAEMRVAIAQDEQAFAEAAMGWNPLDDRCRFLVYEPVGGTQYTSGIVELVIDHQGFTADQLIALGMRSDSLSKMTWTIQLRGLDRRARLVKSNEGEVARITPTTEAAF
jgi:type II secretion system protein H